MISVIFHRFYIYHFQVYQSVFYKSIVFPIYAFFYPQSFGNWLGTIVHAFRAVAGF